MRFGKATLAMVLFLAASLSSSSSLFAQATSLHGIDVTDLDRKADPCNDFYEFANGTWRANNPIPASMTRWSKRWAAGESSKDKLKEILDAAAADKNAPKGSSEQIIGDYYGACMDESRVNARGMEPIKPWFAHIDAAKDTAALQQIIADMHDILVGDPFAFGSQQDPHKPEWVLADIGASGLALPDRDYYLKPEARFKEAREKYVVHIAAMFKLAGWDQKASDAAAQTIMGMETKLAEASLDNVALRDPAATDHNTTFAQLQAMAPHIDWAEYFKHKQIPQDVDMNVDQPKFMQELDRQMHEDSLADWKVYLKWHLLNSTASSLSAPCGRRFRVQWKISKRHDRDEAALEALRGVHRSTPWRSSRSKVCGEIFPARGQGAHAGDGAQSPRGHAR